MWQHLDQGLTGRVRIEANLLFNPARLTACVFLHSAESECGQKRVQSRGDRGEEYCTVRKERAFTLEYNRYNSLSLAPSLLQVQSGEREREREAHQRRARRTSTRRRRMCTLRVEKK